MSVKLGVCGSVYLGAETPSETKQADQILIASTPDSVLATRFALLWSLSSGSQPDKFFAHDQAQAWWLNQRWFVVLLTVLFCCFPLSMFGAPQTSVPELSISPASMSFGYVVVGTTEVHAITLKSTGTAAVEIKYASVSVPGFTLLYPAFPITLQPGQQTTLRVQFDPAVVGVATGQVQISSTSSTNPRAAVDIWGKGRPKPAVLSALACSGASETGPETDACTVTLSAAAPRGGLIVSLSSSNAAVTVPATVMVPPKATSAGFTAVVSAVSTTQTVTLAGNVGGVNERFVLQLNPATPVSVTLTPLSVSLKPSQTQAFTATVANTTNTAVTWSLSAAVGSISAAGLYTAPATITTAQTVTVTATSVANPAVSAHATVSLTPAVSVTLTPLSVSLTPSQTQAFTAMVANTTNTAVTWSLSAAVGSISTAGLYTAPASITTAQTVTVTATSVANPVVSAHATVSLTPIVNVTLNPTSVTLTPGQTQAFTATVANTANTAVTWSLSAAVGSISAAGLYTAPAIITTAQTVNVTATSVANPAVSAYAIVQLNPSIATLNISSTSIPFGSVVVNTTSTHAVTLTSTGTASVTVTAAKVTGAGFTDSGVTFPITLNSSQAVTLNVLFDPTVTGAASGQLTITSNSSTNGTAVIPLSGTVVAASYTVNLSWDAPTSSADPVAGYDIYRSPVGSSTYALMNSSGDTATTYVDSTAQTGLTYDYIVDSVDASGVESVPSNMIVVIIP